MPEEQKPLSWKERNDELKTLKATGDFGWMHLVIARRKSDSQKFLRLKKYQNWFGIPSVKYLRLVQEMLNRGAKELGWDIKNDIDTSAISEVKPNYNKTEQNSKEILESIPEEILDFINSNPKATIRLISALKIDKLDEDDINYLRRLIDILNDSVLKANKKLKVSFEDLLNTITKQDKEGMDKLSDLMQTWSLVQITSITKLIKERLDSIELFERVIHDDKTYELIGDNSIHRILEKSMWIIDENYWLVQSNKSLRSFIGDELEKIDEKYKKKRPDFVCVNSNKKLIIVEIKRPSIELNKEEIDQVELYLRIVKKYKGESYSSIDAYLIGNKVSQEAREILEFRKNIKLMTYQDLLDLIKTRYQEFLKVIEVPE